MYQLVESQKVGKEDTSEIFHGFQKFSKSKIVGDHALYTLANLSLQNGDTVKAIKNLEKALSYNLSFPDQKAKALAKLGDISYDQFLYKTSFQKL
jgi:uncharacterized protein HemY